MNRPRFVTLTVVTLLVLACSSAKAQYPAGCGYSHMGSWSIARGMPPYFSLYPPVYYSYPVPRSYGYSPFAYPYGTPTPEVKVEEVQAKLMINPYVPRPKVAAPAADQTTGGPLTIINPFVQPAHGGDVELAQRP